MESTVNIACNLAFNLSMCELGLSEAGIPCGSRMRFSGGSQRKIKPGVQELVGTGAVDDWEASSELTATWLIDEHAKDGKDLVGESALILLTIHEADHLGATWVSY